MFISFGLLRTAPTPLLALNTVTIKAPPIVTRTMTPIHPNQWSLPRRSGVYEVHDGRVAFCQVELLFAPYRSGLKQFVYYIRRVVSI